MAVNLSIAALWVARDPTLAQCLQCVNRTVVQNTQNKAVLTQTRCFRTGAFFQNVNAVPPGFMTFLRVSGCLSFLYLYETAACEVD